MTGAISANESKLAGECSGVESSKHQPPEEAHAVLSPLDEMEELAREEALHHTNMTWKAQQRLVQRCLRLQLNLASKSSTPIAPGSEMNQSHNCPPAAAAAESKEVTGQGEIDVDSAEPAAKKHKINTSAGLIGLVTCFCCLFVFAVWSSDNQSSEFSFVSDAPHDISSQPHAQFQRRLSEANHDNLLDSTTSSPQPNQNQRRRSLSIFKSCNSMPDAPKPKELPIPQVYFATFPGSGSRITRQLIKALTGLRVQNEHDTRPARDTVAVQTRHPHLSGSLIEWDSEIHRGILLIRNPLYALPSFFDELYVTQKHKPSRFHPEQPVSVEDEASAAEWVSWRDRMFDSQMVSYHEFIRYWIQRYGHDDRVIMAFEDLTDDKIGSEQALALKRFLGRVDAVPTVEEDDVPCVWQTIFKNGGRGGDDGDNAQAMDSAADSPQRVRGRRLRAVEGPLTTNWDSTHRQLASYLIPHKSAVSTEFGSRPFTIDQLKRMSYALQQISEEHYTHSQYLKQTMSRYRQEIMEIIKTLENSGANEGVPVASKAENMEPQAPKFHIFVVTPPGSDSPIVLNWLMGLFEPDEDYKTIITKPRMAIQQNGKEVPITATIVTQTNELNVIGLYKLFKPGFNEVFFILSASGTEADNQIDEEVCNYGNLLCFNHDELQFANKNELQDMVHRLTEKFQNRFQSFFGEMEESIRKGEESAMWRLMKMNKAMKELDNEPYETVDPKFGVHGGANSKQIESVQTATEPKNSTPKRLFYCGSTGSGINRNFSVMGIYLVNSFFPEIIGRPPSKENDDNDEAIQLTESSLADATPNDFLVFLMHQHCDVDVRVFPGLQLHINHPTHGFSAYGQYEPPNDKTFVIGAHDEGPHSIQLPYAMMKWWVMVKGLGSNGEVDQHTVEKFFNPSSRPKNTGTNFLLYVNSHYVAYREMAAYSLSQLGPMHVLGECQGNLNELPKEVVDASRPARCLPYSHDKRPNNIIVPDDIGKGNFFSRVKFQDFRFMLLMEDANISGYITDRIIDGYMAGTVPIYYGTKQIFDIFNSKAFVYFDINNPQEALSRIKYLESNPNVYQQMLNEPILADGDHTIEKYFSFEDSIGNGMLKKRVRSMFGFPV